jgi:tetratricopeptide (TPR) repeat protein
VSTAQALGARIEQLRHEQGMTRPQLAGLSFTSREIAAFESGTKKPGDRDLRILARRLGCSPLYLSHGVTAAREAAVRIDLAAARNARHEGQSQLALHRYEQLLLDPVLPLLNEVHWEAAIGHARAHADLGQYGAAVTELTALKYQTRPGDWMWADVHVALTQCHLRAGDIAEAISTAERALEERIALKGGWGTPGLHVAAALLPAYLANDDLPRARLLAGQLLNRLGDGHDAVLRYTVFSEVARGAAVWRDTAILMATAEKAYAIASEFSLANPLMLANGYAERLLDTGISAAAARALEVLSQPTVFADNPTFSPEATRLVLRARAHLVLGEPAEAIEALNTVLFSPSEAAASSLRGRAFGELGNAYIAMGRPDFAVPMLYQAVHLLHKAGLHDEAEHAWSGMIGAMRATGRPVPLPQARTPQVHVYTLPAHHVHVQTSSVHNFQGPRAVR